MADCALFTYYRPHWSCRGTLGDSWVTSGNVRAPGVMKGRGVSEGWGGRCRASPGARCLPHVHTPARLSRPSPRTMVAMDSGYYRLCKWICCLECVIPPGMLSVMSFPQGRCCTIVKDADLSLLGLTRYNVLRQVIRNGRTSRRTAQRLDKWSLY